MAKKKGRPASAQQPGRAGASASQKAPRAAATSPGRGINAAPPGARLVAEAAGLPCFWWRLHGIWEFVCSFLSRGVFWPRGTSADSSSFEVVGDGLSAATNADAAGGLGASSSAGLGPSATSHGDATRGARSSAASAFDHRGVVTSNAARCRGSSAAPNPAGRDVTGSSSASQDKANEEGSAASNSKIATSGNNQSIAFHSDAAEAPGRITIRMSLRYTRLERRRPQPPPPPAPPRPPLQVVDGEDVPLELENQYREYCRRNISCQGKSSICHMCFFEAKRIPNCTVRNCEMVVHCMEKHGEIGTPCEDRECPVRFRKDSHREGRLHLHFCHSLAN